MVLANLSWRGRLSYFAHAFKAVTRQHHKELRPVLSRFILPDSVVADVGGHSGQFAKLFAGLATEGTVYTFEPGEYPRSILGLAVGIRRLSNITIVAKGLGDTESQLALSTPIKAQGSMRFGLAHMGDDPDPDMNTNPGRTVERRSESVEVTTLDRFALQVGLTRLDFLKADIEGWEQRMLTGGKDTIARFRPVIYIELVDHHLARAGDSLQSAWSLLTSWGYTPMQWIGGDRLQEMYEPWDGDSFWLPDPQS